MYLDAPDTDSNRFTLTDYINTDIDIDGDSERGRSDAPTPQPQLQASHPLNSTGNRNNLQESEDYVLSYPYSAAWRPLDRDPTYKSYNTISTSTEERFNNGITTIQRDLTQIRRLPAIPIKTGSSSSNDRQNTKSSIDHSSISNSNSAQISPITPNTRTTNSPISANSSRPPRPLPKIAVANSNAIAKAEQYVASPISYASPSNQFQFPPSSSSTTFPMSSTSASGSGSGLASTSAFARSRTLSGHDDTRGAGAVETLGSSPSSRSLTHSRTLPSHSTPVKALPSLSSSGKGRAVEDGRRAHPQARNGSGGSGPLRLHEVSPPLEPTNRLSTELETVASVRDSIASTTDAPYGSPRRTGIDEETGLDRVEEERDKRDNEKGLDPDPLPPLEPKVIKKQNSWWRTFIPSSWSCRLFVLVVILEAIFDIIIVANILWRFNKEVDNSFDQMILENRRRLPIYLIIFGLAHLWQIVLTLVAVRSKNTIQAIAVTIFNYAFLGYAVMMIYELRKILGDLTTSLRNSNTDPTNSTDEIFTLPLNILTAVVIGILAVGCVALTILAWSVRKEFGWQRYRFLGADLQIRKLYQRFQIFECICYFAAFFCAGFGIQFIWLVLQPSDTEYIITWIMFPLSLILLIVGRWAAKHENKWLMYLFLLGVLLGEAYFIYKLIRIWQAADTIYYNLTKSLTLFDALSILSLGACGVWAVFVGNSFNRGLKQAVLSSPRPSLKVSALRLFRTRSASGRSAHSVEKGTEGTPKEGYLMDDVKTLDRERSKSRSVKERDDSKALRRISID